MPRYLGSQSNGANMMPPFLLPAPSVSHGSYMQSTCFFPLDNSILGLGGVIFVCNSHRAGVGALARDSQLTMQVSGIEGRLERGLNVVLRPSHIRIGKTMTTS